MTGTDTPGTSGDAPAAETDGKAAAEVDAGPVAGTAAETVRAPEGWSIPAVFDVVAATVPERDALIWVAGGDDDIRRSYAEVADRTAGLAAHLWARGLGTHVERAELERWECGQDVVAMVMHNGPEYIETMLGCWRARVVPANVNHHYRPAELGALLDDLGPAAVVHHRAYGPLLAEALEQTEGVDLGNLILIDVDDGSGEAPLPGSITFECAVATPPVVQPVPSPDDLAIVCTGGTTGSPKAVLWRQADLYRAAMAGAADATAESISAAAAANPGRPWFAVPPLMHAAAQWTAFTGMLGGAPVLLHDDRGSFDPAQVLDAAARERAHLMSVVGDAHARPLVDELRRTPRDLSALAVIGTGGAITTEPIKAALLELVPHAMVLDGYGSSESGTMALGPRTAAGGRRSFRPNAGTTVISADRTRELSPGEDEQGWAARRGSVPLGYLGDRARTEATFPVVDGERMAVPGDRARRLDDGSISLLGRDAMVVNTGGEKVFVEEVEGVLLDHPDIDDALVVGRASDRFGQEVVAVVAPRPGAALDPAQVREFVAERIARFKAPRAVVACGEVRRHANGKADYRWARTVADAASDTTSDAASDGARTPGPDSETQPASALSPASSSSERAEAR